MTNASTIHDEVIAHYKKTFPANGIFVTQNGEKVEYCEKWRFKFVYDAPQLSTVIFVNEFKEVVGLLGFQDGEIYRKKLVGINIIEARTLIHNSLYKTICLKEFKNVEDFKKDCQDNIKLFIEDAKEFVNKWNKQSALWHKWNENLLKKKENEPLFPKSPFHKHFMAHYDSTEEHLAHRAFEEFPNLIHFYHDTKLFPR